MRKPGKLRVEKVWAHLTNPSKQLSHQIGFHVDVGLDVGHQFGHQFGHHNVTSTLGEGSETLLE